MTGGEAHHCPVADRLIRRVRRAKRMLGDKAYDSAELCEELDGHATKSVIPNRSNRKQPFSFSARLYRLRWRIEAAFNRLKDFRRVATRYDRLARSKQPAQNEPRDCRQYKSRIRVVSPGPGQLLSGGISTTGCASYIIER